MVDGMLKSQNLLINHRCCLSLAGAATSMIFVMTEICYNKHVFVMIKHVFCRNKSVLVAKKLLFVATKGLLQQKSYLKQLPPVIVIWGSCTAVKSMCFLISRHLKQWNQRGSR